MNINPTIKKPINIKLSRNGNEIIKDEHEKESYPLNKGAMIGGEHYGFVIITDTKAGQKEELYPTQCKIIAIGIEDKVLKIFEEGKYNSWIFNLDGTLIKHATFNDYSRRDLEFFKENFANYEIEEVNRYRRR